MVGMTEGRGSKSYTLSWVALDRRVLLVQLKSEGAFHGAYIGAVKGEDYDAEALGVVASGEWVSTELAEIYFEDQLGQPLTRIDVRSPYFDEKWPNRGFELFKRLPPPILRVNIVDRHVLAVATRAENNTWKAFIGPSNGVDFIAEAVEITKSGTPISYEVAEVFFKDLTKALTWHEPLRVCIAGEDYGPAEEWGGEKPAVPTDSSEESKLI